MRSAIGILLAGLVVAAPAAADEREDRERDLRAFFENHRVKVLIDMPATSKGVDVDTAAPEPERVAFGKVSERIGQTGASIREGAIVPITKINLKDDTIEFQLGGGGFNSFWNSSGTVSPTYRGKSATRRIPSANATSSATCATSANAARTTSAANATSRSARTRSAASATTTGRCPWARASTCGSRRRPTAGSPRRRR
jgi:hypothetical protein